MSLSIADLTSGSLFAKQHVIELFRAVLSSQLDAIVDAYDWMNQEHKSDLAEELIRQAKEKKHLSTKLSAIVADDLMNSGHYSVAYELLALTNPQMAFKKCARDVRTYSSVDNFDAKRFSAAYAALSYSAFLLGKQDVLVFLSKEKQISIVLEQYDERNVVQSERSSDIFN